MVSVQTVRRELAQTAYELDVQYGIMTRVGLHCAPSAHQTLGTFPTGTIRFSFGWWNTREEAALALQALDELSSRKACWRFRRWTSCHNGRLQEERVWILNSFSHLLQL